MRSSACGGDAGPVVVDDDLDLRRGRRRSETAHGAVGGRERAGVVDEVAEHLAEPAVVAEDEERILGHRMRLDR